MSAPTRRGVKEAKSRAQETGDSLTEGADGQTGTDYSRGAEQTVAKDIVFVCFRSDTETVCVHLRNILQKEKRNQSLSVSSSCYESYILLANI